MPALSDEPMASPNVDALHVGEPLGDVVELLLDVGRRDHQVRLRSARGRTGVNRPAIAPWRRAAPALAGSWGLGDPSSRVSSSMESTGGQTPPPDGT